MSTRPFSSLSNVPRPPVEAKRVTRSRTRNVLGDITVSNVVKKNPNVAKGKENVPKNGYKGEQSKVGASRPEPVQSMVKDLSVLSMVPVSEDRVLPPEVKDIDEDDGDNPQLCSEYATETYVYLKQLEKNYTVRANHLPAGFPTNAKMRAQLIDWLVEVQVQFKLTQETFFRTVHTIDRYKKVYLFA